jgi:kumamolisin
MNPSRYTAGILALGLAALGVPATAMPIFAVAKTPAVAVVANAVDRSDLVDFGSASATTPVHVAVTMRYRNEAELDQLVQLQATPGSPFFHHYLTAEQFAAAFAPAPSDVYRVGMSLAAAGFRIESVSPSRTIIDAVASAPVAARYFKTRIDRVGQIGHGLRYANVTPAFVPAEIASSVSAVLGIDNVVKKRSARAQANVDPSANVLAQDARRADATNQPFERTVSGKFAGIFPRGLAQAYQYPMLSGKTGTGHNIAIVIDSDIANSDLTTFWNAAGVNRTGSFGRVVIDGGPSRTINGDVGETAIDTETTSSLAPGANIYIYLIPSLDDKSIEDAYDRTISDKLVDVTSSSFGGCELDDTPFAKATDQIAEQGAAEGVTFTASTGDAGGYCEDVSSSGQTFYSPDIVNSPASNPHFLAVGATALQINASTGARSSETTWGPGGANHGGGGGVSSYWARPSYQNGISGIAVVPTISVKAPDVQPRSGFAGRNLPDLSVDGSSATGSYIAVYASPEGGWTGYGGTSVANPVIAALIAEQNQVAGSRAGFANPALYSAFTTKGSKMSGTYGGEFYDVTSGTIGSGWSAKSGYDQATGIGSILNGAK